jgi:hypothetical protein
MEFSILSCGIFKLELEKILPDLKKEFAADNIDISSISYISPALHVDNDKLKTGLLNGLAPLDGKKIALLFGSMCHPDLAKLTEKMDINYFKVPNCIEVILSPERKREIENGANVFFMSAGWLQCWKDIFQNGQGWDATDARINLGIYDKIVVLDSGLVPIVEEDLFEFFDYTSVPVEVEPITMDHFKQLLIEVCKRTLAN